MHLKVIIEFCAYTYIDVKIFKDVAYFLNVAITKRGSRISWHNQFPERSFYEVIFVEPKSRCGRHGQLMNPDSLNCATAAVIVFQPVPLRYWQKVAPVSL